MKIYSGIKPLIYGTWILRSTNNNKINQNNQLNYLQIKNDTIAIKTFSNYNYILGLKKSKKAKINFINEDNDTFNVSFTWKTNNIYTYSVLGIEIPEIKTFSSDYSDENNISLQLYNNNIIYINDDDSIYYVFDLYLDKMKYPNIDITFSNFIFSQIFGILFGIFIHKLLEPI